ncbi:anti-CBASS protein Acb1 family protein [Paenibacillus sp. S-38]|uniref:anti-CBASS protein Acb1 family protein n=1 Tax=Paenibacillus sp. S-38 TaxID=3416710 RepID=UPI003CF5F9E2
MSREKAEFRLDNMRSGYNAYRTDFLVGHGKGGTKDALTRQRINMNRRKLSHQELLNYYASNQIVQNIVDIPSEDMTRSWITIKMKDLSLQDKLMRKMRDLKCKECYCDMRRYERLHGDGFVSIGASQKSPFTLEQPLEEKQLLRIDYLHAFSSYKVNNFILNEDMFSPGYGQVEYFQINRRSKIGEQILAGIDTSGEIHRSRVFHDQTRRLEDEYQGQSILEPMWDVLSVFDTALWSVGQILYDYTFKRYKSDGVNQMTREEKAEFQMLADFMFRTEALAIIGENEDIDKVTTNVTGINYLLDFVWESLSGSAKMPKSVIKGQEAGTIAGAQYDVLNYYSRIAAAQETELRPHIERLIRYLLIADGELGGSIDPDSLDWEVVFNPLWNVDQETDAKIRKLQAETDEKYIASGVLTEDEVRQRRFGSLGGAAPGAETKDTEVPEEKQDGLSEEEWRTLMDNHDARMRDRG